jgi:biotin carboxyl carrier protein
MKTTLLSSGTPFTVEYSQHGDEYEAVINEQAVRVRLLAASDGTLTLLINEQPLHVHIASESSRTLVAINGRVYEFTHAQEKRGRVRRRESGQLSPEVRSPMPGKILEVRIAEGMVVEAGQVLVLLEAMKMENALTAEGSARVKKIYVVAGDLVDLGQLLVEIEIIEAVPSSSQPS